MQTTSHQTASITAPISAIIPQLQQILQQGQKQQVCNTNVKRPAPADHWLRLSLHTKLCVMFNKVKCSAGRIYHSDSSEGLLV